MAESPVIEIRTLEAVRNVKDLKDNIVALKGKLDSVSTSTEDYADITKELSRNQAALRNVMNGTHSTFSQSIKDAQGLDTSYNSLVQELKEATQEWRAIPRYLTEADEAQGIINEAWTEAANRVETLRSSLKDMDAATGNYTRNVGNYKSALDGLGGSMGQMKQVGNDMANGLRAVSGVLDVMGISTDKTDTLMRGLQTTVGILTGIKGFAGLLAGLKNTTKAQQAQTTATIASTSATRASTTAQASNAAATGAATAAHVANTAAEGAETVATHTLRGAIEALKVSLTGGLSIAITAVVAGLSTLVSWLTGAKSAAAGLASASRQAKIELMGIEDEFGNPVDVEEEYKKGKERIERIKRENELLLDVMEAEGKSEEELHKQRVENYDDEIWRLGNLQEAEQSLVDVVTENVEEYESTISRLTGLQKLFHKKELEQWGARIEKQKEAKEASEENVKNIQKTIETLEFQKRKEQELYDARKRNESNEELKRQAEEARQEALRALAEIEDLFKSSLTGVDAINAKYDEALEKLEENLAKVTIDEEKANQARAIIEKQRTEALQEEYAKQFSDKYNAYKKSIDVIRKENDETINVYKGLIPSLKDSFEERMKLYEEQSQRTKERLSQDVEEAKRILGDVVDKNHWNAYLEFMTRSNEELKHMYSVMLSDEQAFAKVWPEPFINALKTIGPLILDNEAQTKKDLTQYVNDLMNAYKDAVDANDLEAAAVLRNKLIGNPPVADDADLRAAAEDFVSRMDKKIAEQLVNSENPLEVYFRGSNWSEQLDIHLEKVRSVLDDENATFKEKYEARLKIFEAYNKKYNSFMSTYGAATVNVLDSVADAWEAALQAQVKNGKKSEEQAKKSFKTVKALQVASAVINTAAAVVQALADPTVPSFYVKIANAAAALAAGTAQVLKISATEFSSNANASTESTPQLVDRTPQLQYTIGLNPQEYAQAQSQNPIRAYVVEADLNEGIEHYRRREAETTF